jgi:hypothetical protein
MRDIDGIGMLPDPLACRGIETPDLLIFLNLMDEDELSVRDDRTGVTAAPLDFPEDLRSGFGTVKIQSRLLTMEIETGPEKVRPVGSREQTGREGKKGADAESLS